MIVREVLPGVAVWTVVLPHRAPLSFREIWAPPAPCHLPKIGFGEALALRTIFLRRFHGCSSVRRLPGLWCVSKRAFVLCPSRWFQRGPRDRGAKLHLQTTLEMDNPAGC